ncbi:unnamed protein product [Clonostachys rosea f. rosea IK726]|uniref:Uncharacterized protein n=1 Tax=Clonostachys rosea f. rosea IK726 TaxID=1349383 RepID=A0ACA9TZ45_BIOOC|nr:unnamed protein product [Clonostachys rosea f. rosea IK726]
MLHLPNEILEAIVSWLETQRDINALVRTSRRLCYSLNSTLYRRNVEDSGGSALTWAVIHRRELTGKDPEDDTYGDAEEITAEETAEGVAEETAIKAVRAGARGGEALWRSVRYRDEKMAKLILSSDNADSEMLRGDDDAYKVLDRAIKAGHVPVVKLLMERARIAADSPVMKVSHSRRKQTPLYQAIDWGQEPVIEMMMSLGEIDINARGYMGETPFTMAAALGLAVTVKLFLDSGKADAGSYTDDNSSALMLAISGAHDDTAKMLLLQDGVDVNHANDDGHRALSLAAREGLEDMVKTLIDMENVEVDFKDNRGFTPLVRASQRGHLSIVELLLDSGGVDPDDRFVGDYRKTLARAVYAQHLPVIRLLLDSGYININEVDERHRTALHHACGLHAEEVVEYLLQRDGIDANITDNKGFTPLMIAAASSRGFLTVKILLQSGKVDIALQSHDGATAISIAHTKRRGQTFQLLENWDRRSKGE